MSGLQLSAVLIAVLIVGSIIRVLRMRTVDPETAQDRLTSLKTWWALSLCFGFALISGQAGICVLMTLISWVAFLEFDCLIHKQSMNSRDALSKNRIFFYLLIGIHYTLIYLDQTSAALWFLPLAGTLLVTCLSVWAGRTENYVHFTAGRLWGLIVVGYLFSFGAMLVEPSPSPLPWDDHVLLLFVLVLLTEANDIAQAIIGKRFGAAKRFPLAKALSPGKTWEGWIGGLVVTTAASIGLFLLLPEFANHQWQLASYDLSTPVLPAIILAAVITTTGVMGDLNISGLKRDAQVKDSSDWLPGMGGVLDRLDSLTFTAPAMYILWNYVFGGPLT